MGATGAEANIDRLKDLSVAAIERDEAANKALAGVAAVDPGVADFLAGNMQAVPTTPAGAYLLAYKGLTMSGMKAAEGAVAGAGGGVMGAKGMAGMARGSVGLSQAAVGFTKGFIASAEGLKGTAIFVKLVGITNIILSIALILAGAGLFIWARAAAKPSGA
jgi:hypothetical protein